MKIDALVMILWPVKDKQSSALLALELVSLIGFSHHLKQMQLEPIFYHIILKVLRVLSQIFSLIRAVRAGWEPNEFVTFFLDHPVYAQNRLEFCDGDAYVLKKN